MLYISICNFLLLIAFSYETEHFLFNIVVNLFQKREKKEEEKRKEKKNKRTEGEEKQIVISLHTILQLNMSRP